MPLLKSLSQPAPTRSITDGATRKQIRGSTLLLAGRCVALAINLAVQIVTVRYLTKEDFGAFAFGITMVALGTNLSLLGLNKSLSRFVPIYQERGDTSRLAGALALMFGTVLGLGLATVAIVVGCQSLIAREVVSDPFTLSLLLILIVLTPVEAVDRMFEATFAAFGKVRSIFIRRHVVGPGLKLLAVLAVVSTGGGVRMLAVCYVAAAVAGLLLYAALLHQLLRQARLASFFRPSRWTLPTGEVFRYSLPLLSSQISFVVRTSLAVLLLEMLSGTEHVAELRAVFPFARLNEVVITSFAFLFTPLASRMFARSETAGVDQLYWRTSVWIMMFSLPAFLVTGVLAQPFTALVLGERYASAGPVLLVLAIGFFVDAVLGFNVHTLRVFAKVRQIVAIDLISIGTTIGLCLMLIPVWGAMGAAVAICITTIAQNILFQVAMRVSTGVGVLQWHYVRFYLVTATGVLAVALAQWVWSPPLWIGGTLAAVVYLALLAASRSLMEAGDTFPELARIPFVGRLIVPGEPNRPSVARGGP